MEHQLKRQRQATLAQTFNRAAARQRQAKVDNAASLQRSDWQQVALFLTTHTTSASTLLLALWLLLLLLLPL